MDDQPVYCLGDLHGAWPLLKQWIKQYNIENCIMIICGDIGMGFEKDELTESKLLAFNKFLRLRGITLFGLRGNHDDPAYFNREIKDPEKVEKYFYSNLKLVPDYTILNVSQKNLLMIGGAVSIDRVYRKENYKNRISTLLTAYPSFTEEDAKDFLPPSYWEDELPFVNPDIIHSIKKDGILISHVLTHTCPSFAFPTHKNGIKGWIEKDENLKNDLDYERSVMDNIYSLLLDDANPIEEWVYGHFHKHHQEDHNGIRFTTLANTDSKFDPYEITRADASEFKL